MKSSESGQMLLIAICIFLVLLICIPSIVFINSMGIRHQTQSQKLVQGQAIAEEGIAFASAQLSVSAPIWNNAVLNNAYPTSTGCNTGTNVAGTQFRLTCSNSAAAYPGLQPYEIAIVSTAWLTGPNGSPVATKSLQTFLSPKTMGAFLADGTRASAALELTRVPSPNPLPAGALTVHWGPVICRDTTTPTPWTLGDPLDRVTATPFTFQGYPRKFSAGGITGTGAPATYPRSPNHLTSALTTDNKEYWAFASLGFPATIDEYHYVQDPAIPNAAYNEIGIPARSGCTGTGTSCSQQGGDGQAGYFFATTAGDQVVFDGYSVAGLTNPVIYVQGDALFNNLAALNMGDKGAFIVSGDLTLGSSPGGTYLNMNIPIKAAQEYPYWPASATAQWIGEPSCNPDSRTGICQTSNPTYPAIVNFRGFLWVKGKLIVDGPWVFDGVILVGDPATGSGQLVVNAGINKSLTVYYDDRINHYIAVNPR